MKYRRIFLLLLDSIGIGEAQDAFSYGDAGANTLKSIVTNYKDLFIPNLTKLGFLNYLNPDYEKEVNAYYTLARPNNIGKDSLSNYYEIFGVSNKEKFKDFSKDGFPQDLMKKISNTLNIPIIGNIVTSKRQDVIDELGDRSIQTKSIIIFTSSNSTLEIAAHEDVVSLPNLIKMGEIVRNKICDKDEYQVGRVIIRPFVGKNKYRYTNDSKEFALPLNENTILDNLKDAKKSVISIGKTSDLFNEKGITKKIMTKDKDSLESTVGKLLDIMDKNFEGLCVTVLNDFDIASHNHNIKDLGEYLEELDVQIPLILNKIDNNDLLIIASPNGNDPLSNIPNHTRENVPVIIVGRLFKENGQLRVLETKADIAATIAQNFDLDKPPIGTSFLDELK